MVMQEDLDDSIYLQYIPKPRQCYYAKYWVGVERTPNGTTILNKAVPSDKKMKTS